MRGFAVILNQNLHCLDRVVRILDGVNFNKLCGVGEQQLIDNFELAI